MRLTNQTINCLRVILIAGATTLWSGCSSSGGGNSSGATGPHANYHWDQFVGAGSRCGYGPEEINRYSLPVSYKPGDDTYSGTWGSQECNCLAYNQKLSNYRHQLVFFGPPAAPSSIRAAPWLASHEGLHSFIESNPEHGGAPLPATHRKGGTYSHPNQIYVMGAWRKCTTLVGGRWPALINSRKPLGGVPPYNCEQGDGANNWH